jgi:hypothetical protein
LRLTPARRRKFQQKKGSVRPPAFDSPTFDSLESRLLLAATDYAFLTGTQLSVRGGDATSADVITLAKSGSNITVTIDVSSDFLGGGDLVPFTVNFPAAAVTAINVASGAAIDTINITGLFASMPLTIDSGDGADIINIGGTNLDNIASNITLADTIAGDAVTIDDTAASVARSVTLSSTTLFGLGTSVITYNPADLAALNVNGGARGNTYTVLNAGATTSPLITTLNTGNGVDNVFVRATSGRLNVYGMNGLDNVHIGDAGSVAAIAGAVYVNNVNNRSAIFIDDFADAASSNWMFNASAITNLAPGVINYVGSSTRLLEVNTGAADDVANIFGSSALDTTINGAGGAKIINFFNGGASSGLTKPLTLANTAGQSSISIDASGDTTARNITISSTGVTGIAAGSILFDPADISSLSLVGGNAGNTYNIVSTIPGKALTIFGGAGSDTAIVRGPFGSKIIFNGGPNFTGPGDSMQIIGTGTENAVYTPSTVNSGDGAVNVGGQTILFNGLEPLIASNLASMTLVTPNGPDSLTIDSPAAGRNRISGTSGGVGFESLTIFSIPSLILDLSKNDGLGGDDSITINSSGLVATALTQLSLNAGSGNNTFNIQGGAAKLDPNLGTLGGANLQVNASGNAVLTVAANQSLAGLNISNTARVNIPAANSYLRLNSLTIAPTAALDLFDNDLIIQSTSASKAALLTTINSYLKTGRASGAWTGFGIRSTTASAANPRITTLGAVVNDRGNGSPILTQIDGQSTDINTIIIKYTYSGDADLNGLINADDYAFIDAGYANRATAKGFRNGDFDYSGSINADDFFLIDRAMSAGAAPLAPAAPLALAAPLAPAAPAASTLVASKKRPKHHRHPRPRPHGDRIADATASPALARWLGIA